MLVSLVLFPSRIKLSILCSSGSFSFYYISSLCPSVLVAIMSYFFLSYVPDFPFWYLLSVCYDGYVVVLVEGRCCFNSRSYYYRGT